MTRENIPHSWRNQSGGRGSHVGDGGVICCVRIRVGVLGDVLVRSAGEWDGRSERVPLRG